MFLAVGHIARAHVDEGEARGAGGEGQRFGGRLDLGVLVDLPFPDRQQLAQDIAVELLQIGLDAQFAELVAAALIQREGHGEAVAVRRQLGHRRDDAEVVEAAVAVEFAQLLAVVLDPVGVVVVVRLEEFVPVAFLGDDLVAQLVVRELHVAKEVDAQDAALGALVDLEDQVDALLRQVDDLRRDGCRDPARTPVELDDAGDVGLDLGLGEDAARAHLHLVLQLVFLEVRIALEQHLIDDRILDKLDHQISALQVDLHVGEQLGARQGLQRQVDLGRIDRVADLDRQVRDDRVLLDPLIALDDDSPDHAALLRLRVGGLGRDKHGPAHKQSKAGYKRGATGAGFSHRISHDGGAYEIKPPRK